MSRKRYISTELSTDTKIADLADCGLLAPLLFTWAIPHMDDWGRITGNAREFKLLVCPGLNISNSDVDEAINHIVKAKLWRRYEQDGKLCITVMNQDNWFKHQSYIGKDKRLDDSKSSFHKPPQNTEERRETPKNAEKERETPQNTSSFSLSVSSSLSSSVSKDTPITATRTYKDNPFSLFETHKFGKLDSLSREFIGDTIDTYTEEWVIHAIKVSLKSNVAVWNYVEKILKRWKLLNHSEPWTLEKEEPPPKNNVRNFDRNSSYSGKRSIPIITDGPKTEPLSDERREAMRQKARLLDSGGIS